MGEKSSNPISAVTVADLPAINAVIARGETVEIRPGENGTAKIMKVKRTFLNVKNRAGNGLPEERKGAIS